MASQRTLVLSGLFGENHRMSSPVNVVIDPSQFPEKVRKDLHDSLRARKVNHKFHYDSIKQTQKWLALHQAYSPSRHDTDVAEIYNQSFEAAAKHIDSKKIHLIGLGCGGGQKDTRLARLLAERGKNVFYTPCDVSTAMVLTAQQTASAVLPLDHCSPVVCDLAGGDNPALLFAEQHPALITFFGMIPNFEPDIILPRLASLVGPEDALLFSANLAPGEDYDTGVRKILPQYDNVLTRDWLMAFLFDLGIESADGELKFSIEETNGLKRIVARFEFTRARSISLDEDRFEFRVGESIRLFFSYRYTPALVRKVLGRHALTVAGEWIAGSGEEGVFLCRRGRV